MITVHDIARKKQSVHILPDMDGVKPAYDHGSQLGWQNVDEKTFKISMKSDTLFDGERDPGDER